MKNMISMNSIELMTAADRASIVASGINVTLEEWSSQGEKSIALEAYAQQFYELERTMLAFQKIIHSDVDSIREIGKEFFLADFKLAKLWGRK